MKKITSFMILISILFWFYTQTTNALNKKYFRVTAYYSPLPNQKYYIKGNYLAEKRMNWEWIRWASWKAVFSGMLAAPTKYNFWTKIYLKWLGIWEVADRWWAIVKAWERKFKYDRIDVWVWYWDEGLRRAMYWGNRVVEWYITNKKEKTTLNYKKIPAPNWAIPKTKNVKYTKYLSYKKDNKIIKSKFEINLDLELKIFDKRISSEKDTKILQEKLKNLWLYNWEINWNYNNIKDIITKYQLENKLIKKVWELGTGYFWPKTRASLKKDYKNYLVKKEEEKKQIENYKKQIEELKDISAKNAKKTLNNIWYVKYNEISSWVRELQKALKKLGYFDYKDTAIFWAKTKNALIDFQLARNVIKNKYEPGTWVFWPNTKKQLLSDLANYYLIQELNKNEELLNFYLKK